MSAIRLRGATSGTTDVVAAAIAGDGVMTLPTGTGTLATTAFVNTAVAAGGKVLQVVSVAKTDIFSTSSSTFTDITGMAATITPSSVSSKILLLVQLSMGAEQQLRITGGNAANYIGDAFGSRTRATVGYRMYLTNEFLGLTQSIGITYLDSPATASAVTYQIQVRSTTGGVAFLNRPTDSTDSATYTVGASSITLMEVGA